MSTLRRLLNHLLLLAAWIPAAPAADDRPNVILILADDLGFSDPGCYGGEIRTPNIDRLASGGLRFRQFFNCSRCCPTRASLLTGHYAHEVGLQFNGRSLSGDVPTLAESLREAGYRTAMSGKWHLSVAEPLAGGDFNSPQHLAWVNHQSSPGPLFAPKETYPAARGFERHYGIVWGVIDFFDPFSLVDGFEPVRTLPPDYYLTDAISERAVKDIRDFSAGDAPFFLYVAYTSPHWPLHARPEDIARYQDQYSDGWDALRKTRYERQVALNLFDAAQYPLPELQTNGREWDKLTAEQRAVETAKMRVHAAMVDRMDQGIGEILQVLADTGELDDTLILFLSDNGASPEVVLKPGYDRPSETRNGETIQYGDPPANEIGRETTYTMIGPAWASAVNTPFRFWKKESFEGGNHTPCIAHWPAGLTAPAGSITDSLCHVIDIVPTVYELAGLQSPAEFHGHKQTLLPGRSFATTLRGKPLPNRGPLYFEHEKGAAIRSDGWKLVHEAAKPKWQLYDMATDRTETRDLASSQPARVAELSALWDEWFQSVKKDAAETQTLRRGRARGAN